MKETVSFVNLNCLNCGAKLKITGNIFEFACQYCGTAQIVEREGGIVVLNLIDQIDRVQHTVDQTAAELKLQRLTNQLDELREKHTKLDEATNNLKSLINSVAIPLLFAIAILTIFISAGSRNFIPFLIGTIVVLMVFISFRKIIHNIEADYRRVSKPLIEKGIELKNKIVELKKVVEY